MSEKWPTCMGWWITSTGEYKHCARPAGHETLCAVFECQGDAEFASRHAAPESVAGTLTEEQVRYMVNRFLMWRLPENFNPDAGISFKAAYNESTPWPAKHEPVGTNLFDATQTEAMIRYLIDGIPLSTKGGGE